MTASHTGQTSFASQKKWPAVKTWRDLEYQDFLFLTLASIYCLLISTQ